MSIKKRKIEKTPFPSVSFDTVKGVHCLGFILILFFGKDNLLGSVFGTFRNQYIIETDSPRMKRMAPYMFMTVKESQHRNGYPAINKDRIKDGIEPRFRCCVDF